MKDLKLMISEEEVQKRIEEMAKQIDKDYNEQEIVVVCVLKGAVFFTVDLVKRMKAPVILECVQVSSYEGTESTGRIVLKKDLDDSIEGKDVLIVEDIIDTGNTLNSLKEYLLLKKPKSLKIASLLDKKERRKANIEVDYAGFVIEDKFVIGYGLDYNEFGRNIPYIGYYDK